MSKRGRQSKPKVGFAEKMAGQKEPIILSKSKLIRKSAPIENRLMAVSEILELTPSQLARLAVDVLVKSEAEKQKFDVSAVSDLLDIPIEDVARVAQSNGLKIEDYGNDHTIGVGDDVDGIPS